MNHKTRSLYPKSFASSEVKTLDENGFPLLTEFYKHENKTGIVFTWTQVWNDKGVCTSHVTNTFS